MRGKDVQLCWMMAKNSGRSNRKACEARSDGDHVVHTCAYGEVREGALLVAVVAKLQSEDND